VGGCGIAANDVRRDAARCSACAGFCRTGARTACTVPRWRAWRRHLSAAPVNWVGERRRGGGLPRLAF